MLREQPPAGGPSLRVAGLAAASAAIEWYDFFLYGTAAALVFPRVFFAAGLPLFVAQIAAFSTFAVGFVARPIGGMLFGHIGDRYGRKQALVLAMLIMGLATTAIGCLPGYATLGGIAPLLLVICRFVQGLAVGGQWGGAALLAIESAPAGRRGFYGSFVQIGVPLGVVLANLVFLLASALAGPAGFLAWGWRIGFLLSITVVAIGLYVHFTLPAPKAPVRAPGAGSPLRLVIAGHWRVILLAGGAFVANNSCFYVAITYAVAYGTESAGIARNVMLFAVLFGSVAMVPALIVCGALSDRFGRRGIFMLGASLSGAWAFAMFPLLDTGSPVAATAAITIALLCISLMYGPQAALFAELFPRALRYSGASLGYQIGAVVGGGLAPIVATTLFARYHASAPIAGYLAAMCALSLASIVLLGRRPPIAGADHG